MFSNDSLWSFGSGWQTAMVSTGSQTKNNVYLKGENSENFLESSAAMVSLFCGNDFNG
jgi:hypothetical protein